MSVPKKKSSKIRKLPDEMADPARDATEVAIQIHTGMIFFNGIGFTIKEAKFIDNYMTSMNAKESAVKAGYSEHSIIGVVYHLLKKKKIQDEIARRHAYNRGILQIDEQRVLGEVAALAFSNITEVIEWDKDGERILDSSSLPTRVAVAVKSVTIKEGRDGTRTIKVEMHEKAPNLDKLMRYLGAYAPEKVKVVDDDSSSEAARLEAREDIERRLSKLIAVRNEGGVLPLPRPGGTEPASGELEVLGEGQPATPGLFRMVPLESETPE